MFQRKVLHPLSGLKSKPSKLSLLSASAGFLYGVLFDSEGGGDMFL
jgi:hypothetical protein